LGVRRTSRWPDPRHCKRGLLVLHRQPDHGHRPPSGTRPVAPAATAGTTSSALPVSRSPAARAARTSKASGGKPSSMARRRRHLATRWCRNPSARTWFAERLAPRAADPTPGLGRDPFEDPEAWVRGECKSRMPIKASGSRSLVLSVQERLESLVQIIRRGSPAISSPAEAANTTGSTGPTFNAQAIIAPTYQPVADHRMAARARFFMSRSVGR
jgi:hypothetical protein